MRTLVKISGVAIHGYGGYIPKLRIKSEEIARIWGKGEGELPVKEKSVNNIDEDTITMALEAAKYAIARAEIDPKKIGAVNVGSESHPYAVKPSGTVVAEALGIGPSILSADFEFACKAGSEAMQMIIGLVSSGMIEYGLAIGSDTAQGRPGDALEYTAAAGAAAFVIGKSGNNVVAEFEASKSYVTDTPDFWRRDYERYPVHASRFTGEPAYFHHTISAVKMLLDEEGYKLSDFDYFVFHQPNAKFPYVAAKMLGIPSQKIEAGMLSNFIGNTYSACSLLGLVKVLDEAKPGQRILITSYGSGAGSDSFVLKVSEGIEDKRAKAPLLTKFIQRATYIDYARYLKHRDKIRV
ncbi:MAG: hydroxymethylglutaryl-CoA synthase [Nitrososphaerota archaeon]